MTPLIRIYFLFTFLIDRFSYLIVLLRLWRGKEDNQRYLERLGKYKKSRPEAKLIWFHGASIGETLSIIGLIRAIKTIDEKVRFLITSGTKSSSQVLLLRMPKNSLHQFVPIDTPSAVKSFLSHWKPDLAILIESEIWPRLIIETSRSNIPIWLLNGSMSSKTYKKWRYFPLTAQYLYSKFDKILLKDQKSASYLLELGFLRKSFEVYGSLKAVQEELVYCKADLKKIKAELNKRKVWLASSTHPGEDEIILKAHINLLKINKNILLILVPRHPERGFEIHNLVRSMRLRGSLRSKCKTISEKDQVYIADTLGELGLWYRLSSISFIGGSISKNGGHNPYEAIFLDTVILHGPHTFNFEEIYQKLDEEKCAIKVYTSDDISREISNLISSKCLSKKCVQAKNLITIEKEKLKVLSEQINNCLKEQRK